MSASGVVQLVALAGAILAFLVSLVTLATVVWKGGSYTATIAAQISALTDTVKELRKDVEKLESALTRDGDAVDTRLRELDRDLETTKGRVAAIEKLLSRELPAVRDHHHSRPGT